MAACRRHRWPVPGKKQTIRRAGDRPVRGGPMGDISSPPGGTHRQPCATRIPELLPVYRAARIESGNWLQTGSACRPQPAAASGLNPSRPLAPTGSGHPAASGMADAQAVDRQRPRWVKIAPPCRPRTQTRFLRQDHIRYSTLRSSCASRWLTNRGLTVSGKRMSGCTV